MPTRAKNSIATMTILTLLAGAAGCTTVSSGPSTQDTVYATHRMVKNLDQSLKASVDKLNETTGNLATRVEEYDVQITALRSVAEGNQSKIDNLQARLDELTSTLYQRLNLTPPTGHAPQAPPPSSAGIATESIVVAPPTQTPAETPQEPAYAPVPPPPPAAESEVQQPAEEAQAPAPAAPATATVPAPAAPAPTAAPAGNPVDEYKQARDQYIANKYADALTLFDAYVSRYPGTELESSAQFWKAQCLFKLERYSDATQEFSKYRQKFPDQTSRIPMAMHQEAVALANTGQTDKAKALFEELIKNYPADPAADGAREKLKELQGQ